MLNLQNSLQNSNFVLKNSKDDIRLKEVNDESENLNDSLEYSTNKKNKANNKQISSNSNRINNFNFITSPGPKEKLNYQTYSSFIKSNSNNSTSKKVKRLILTTPKHKKEKELLLLQSQPKIKTFFLSTTKKDSNFTKFRGFGSPSGSNKENSSLNNQSNNCEIVRILLYYNNF